MITENLLQRAHISWRLLQTGTPFGEDGLNLLGVLFGDEPVRSCLGVEQQGFQRQPGSIVRVQVKISAGLGRGSVDDSGKCEPADSRGKKGQRHGLRTAEKEVAATLIGQNTIYRMSRLPYPTQSDAPQKPRTKNRNLTVGVSARQGSPISLDGIGENRPDPLKMERRASSPVVRRCPRFARAFGALTWDAGTCCDKIRDYNGFSSRHGVNTLSNKNHGARGGFLPA